MSTRLIYRRDELLKGLSISKSTLRNWMLTEGFLTPSNLAHALLDGPPPRSMPGWKSAPPSHRSSCKTLNAPHTGNLMAYLMAYRNTKTIKNAHG